MKAGLDPARIQQEELKIPRESALQITPQSRDQEKPVFLPVILQFLSPQHEMWEMAHRKERDLAIEQDPNYLVTSSIGEYTVA